MTMSYETLLCQNMLARIKNLGNAEFWKLWWQHWVLRPFLCSSDTNGAKNLDTHKHHWPLMLFWFPASLILLACHVLPLFSVWANYMRYVIQLHATVSKIRPTWKIGLKSDSWVNPNCLGFDTSLLNGIWIPLHSVLSILKVILGWLPLSRNYVILTPM